MKITCMQPCMHSSRAHLLLCRAAPRGPKHSQQALQRASHHIDIASMAFQDAAQGLQAARAHRLAHLQPVSSACPLRRAVQGPGPVGPTTGCSPARWSSAGHAAAPVRRRAHWSQCSLPGGQAASLQLPRPSGLLQGSWGELSTCCSRVMLEQRACFIVAKHGSANSLGNAPKDLHRAVSCVRPLCLPHELMDRRQD